MNKLSIVTLAVIATMPGTIYSENYSLHSPLAGGWTGFYAGINAGLGINKAEVKSQQLGFTSLSEQCNTSSNATTFFPGLQLGYLHQFSNTLVAGVEANVIVNVSQKDALGCTCPINPHVSDRFQFNNEMQSSVKGRIGRSMVWQNRVILPYLTTGVSFVDAGLTYQNEEGDYYSKSTTKAGFLIGTGIEWAFKSNWSLRAEYNYVDYGNLVSLRLPSVYGLIDDNGNAKASLTANNVALSINYWI